MKQEYVCEKCGLKSSVEYDDRKGIMFVIHKIEDDHLAKSPDCDNPVARIRIVSEDKNV